MKTTVDIPDDVFKPLMAFTKAATKRDAIVAACREYVRRERVKEIISLSGTFDDMMTVDELMDMRWERGKYAPSRHGKLDRLPPPKRQLRRKKAS